jgi:hypothetical protein
MDNVMMAQIDSSIPAEEMAFRIFGAVLWISGISMVSRFIQTRSLRTDFDAQFFVDRTLLKNTGLKNIQAKEIAAGIAHHQPTQTLLQKASTIRGRTEYRVHTLQGFACFIQFFSLSLKTDAIFRSTVIRFLPFD